MNDRSRRVTNATAVSAANPAAVMSAAATTVESPFGCTSKK